MKARLIVASSERDANMLYATGFFVPDAFIWFEVRGRTYAVLSDLEIDRAKKHAQVDRVLAYRDFSKRLKNPKFSDVLRLILRQYGVRSAEVPANFPFGLARQLRSLRLTVPKGEFFPARALKTPAEVQKIRAALGMAEAGVQAAIELIRSSRIGRDGLLNVTSEQVRGVINQTIAGLGGVASDTIVAGGNQACDPHEVGHGWLRAHWPVIIDVFPRDIATGYFGDITRTVVRGRASEAVRKLYAAVHEGQKLGFDRLRDGVNGREVHNAIMELFTKRGYKTGPLHGRMQGFFHGTGHGLGLDIHESPSVGARSQKLKAGNVVTVEPGLYYWGIGGVRLEDVALIQARDARNLTTLPKELEI
jgi:Xaa-Pro aminopeptidase